jgi:hypothetical protein
MRSERTFSTLCVEEMALICDGELAYQVYFDESSRYWESLIWPESGCFGSVSHWDAALFRDALQAKLFYVPRRLGRVHAILQKIERGRLRLLHREFGFPKFGHSEF